MKSDEELVVDDCHLYSSVPKYPLGARMLVKAEGALPEQISWAVAIVPPPEGFVHVFTVRSCATSSAAL